jgi:alcohol dehydrogenase class IV
MSLTDKTNGSYLGRVSNFFSPSKIALGVDAAKTVGTEAKALGARKVLIVTDPGVVKAGLVDGIRQSLLAQSIEVGLYDKVEFETPARVIDEGAALARAGGFQLIVGLGGGTTLDTAKGVALLATNKGSVLDYVGMELAPTKALPKIQIPTTGGSGSEITRVFALTDEGTKTKTIVYSFYNLAEVVILDPALTVSLPPSLTADTGMDALGHAIEAYVSVNGTPFSDLLALEAIRLVSENLLAAYAKGENMAARYTMLLAASLAGLAWASGGLGAAHALSYTLETEHQIGHARAIAVILPYVMEFNKIGNLEKFGRIASVMGESTEDLSAGEASDRAVAAVKKLLHALNISIRLSDYGVSAQHIDRLVEGAMKQARLFVPNPRNLTEDDVRMLYVRALG